jgi:Cu2+-exporting ATPase
VRKEQGATVIAGTVNGAGSLRVEVTGTGDTTALAGIMRLVADAQSSKSRAQALADRAAFYLTFVAIAAAVVTLVAWTIAGAPPSFVIERVVTVLVIACPHALGLAVPLVVAISTALGARNGLLVRDRRGLEQARGVTAVFFDKTGTLTRGEFRVVETTTVAPMTDVEALALAAAVEHDSEHTIAQGIVKSAEERGLSLPPAGKFQAIPGRGVQAWSTAVRSSSAGRRCCGSRVSACFPRSRLLSIARRRAVRPPSRCWMTGRRWPCSRWRMRSGRSRAKRWSACTISRWK